MTISIVNPADFPDWDGSIRPLCGHSFFHTSAWAGTLRKSYHYTPYYFVDRTATDMKALLPLMEVNSLITGKRGVSLPFTDYCEPLVPDVARFEELFRAVLEFGKKQNWNYVEIRGGESFFHDAQPAEYHFGHTLDLTKGTDPIFLRLRDSTRRNIKKAKREGVTITLSASPDSMEEFRRLNALTRRDHGLPPQPACFFRNLFDAIISKDRGVIALASFKGKAVAANVYPINTAHRTVPSGICASITLSCGKPYSGHPAKVSKNSVLAGPNRKTKGSDSSKWDGELRSAR
jgi:hypothetical protein